MWWAFSMWSEALPLAAGVLARARLTSTRVWIMFWSAVYLIMNLSAKYLAEHHLNNHFLSYIALPVQAFAVLWALALWQERPTARLTLRLAIPAILIAFAFTMTLDDIRSFSAVSEPVYSIVALGAAIFTLLTRSQHEIAPLMQQDWFWVCAGLILHFGALAVLTPFASYYVTREPQLVFQAYNVRAVINTVGFILIAAGVYSPSSPRSGPSS